MILKWGQSLFAILLILTVCLGCISKLPTLVRTRNITLTHCLWTWQTRQKVITAKTRYMNKCLSTRECLRGWIFLARSYKLCWPFQSRYYSSLFSLTLKRFLARLLRMRQLNWMKRIQSPIQSRKLMTKQKNLPTLLPKLKCVKKEELELRKGKIIRRVSRKTLHLLLYDQTWIWHRTSYDYRSKPFAMKQPVIRKKKTNQRPSKSSRRNLQTVCFCLKLSIMKSRY